MPVLSSSERRVKGVVGSSVSELCARSCKVFENLSSAANSSSCTVLNLNGGKEIERFYEGMYKEHRFGFGNVERSDAHYLTPKVQRSKNRVRT